MHHPWRMIRGLVDWTVHFTHDLPADVMGVTRWRDRTIWVAHGLTQVERRCVIEHERQHALRGPGGTVESEERLVEIATAHALITLEDLARAARWAQSKDELADELFVTRDVLDVRLAHLHPAERAYLKKELAEETGA